MNGLDLTCLLYFFLQGFQSNEPFTVRAHKVELATDVLHGCYRKKYKVVDGSGDALVIKVTNNEKFLVHVCVMAYQADGSIVVLYPPKNVSNQWFPEWFSVRWYDAFAAAVRLNKNLKRFILFIHLFIYFDFVTCLAMLCLHSANSTYYCESH